MNNTASFKSAQGRNVKHKKVAETKTVTLCKLIHTLPVSYKFDQLREVTYLQREF
jgi:hypothetical protein